MIAKRSDRPSLSEVSEEFPADDVLQDHVDIAWVMEGAKHVHDEWVLQLGQNPWIWGAGS